jgi:putative copper export protein
MSMRQLRRPPNILLLVFVVLLIGILLTAVNIYQLRAMQHEHYQSLVIANYPD